MCTTSKWNLIIFASESRGFLQVVVIPAQDHNILFFHFFLLLSPTQNVSLIAEE
jgi:hypothetical protein